VPVSTVLADAAGSPASNEVENAPGAGAAAALAGRVTAAAPESTTAAPAIRAATGRSPWRRGVGTDECELPNMRLLVTYAPMHSESHLSGD
jgi:hypothetical protein